MRLPRWTSEIGILWLCIIFLDLVIIVISIALIRLSSENSRLIRLTHGAEVMLDNYLEENEYILKGLNNLSEDLEAMIPDPELIYLQQYAAAPGDTNVLAMGGSEHPFIEIESDEN